MSPDRPHRTAPGRPASPDAAAGTPLTEPVAPERLEQLRAMPFAEYRRTAEWHRTRIAALTRADHRCERDPAHDDRGLEVVHTTRERIGAELAADVVVLCAACREARRDGAFTVPRSERPSAPEPIFRLHAEVVHRPPLLHRLLRHVA